jgi:hypothetical protein
VHIFKVISKYINSIRDSLVDQYLIASIHKGDFKIMKNQVNILFHIKWGEVLFI